MTSRRVLFRAPLGAIGLVCLAASASFARVAAPLVKPADTRVLKAAVSSYRGRVVVVNFWATWCDPCKAEFPDLVRLNNTYRTQGLVVLAVSGDMARDIDTKVRPFLIQERADFPEFILHTDDWDAFVNAFDPPWQGEFPHTLIYDRQGHLAKSLNGAQTLASWSAAIKPYLQSKA